MANSLRYVHRQFELDGDQGRKLPSYALWDLRLSKKILSAELYAAADNLTNRHYAESFGFGTLNPQPGRAFWTGIKIEFVD